MFLAAGQVIEVVSGQSWSEFVETRILKRLGMDRTVTSTNQLLSQGNYATPHKTVLPDQSLPLPWMNWDSMAAAGGIISSVHDMSHWIRLQLRHGAIETEQARLEQAADDRARAKSETGEKQARLFSVARSEDMWSAHMPIPTSASQSQRFPSTHFRAYGLGWSLSDYLGRKIVGHGGGYDGMYSQVVLVPEENLGMVILTNSMTSISPAISYQILDAYLGGPKKDWSEELLPIFIKSREKFDAQVRDAITAVASDTLPSHAWEAYVGKFRCPLYGDVSIDLAGNQLVISLLPYTKLTGRLEHLHYDTFVIRWDHTHAWFDEGVAHFVANAKGQFDRLELYVPNDDLWFHELDLHRVRDGSETNDQADKS